jgi:membrane protein DedA with SNARE-associated domain
MPDLNELVEHWGYLAVFLIVLLGNMGLPVPEETILALAGYLVWEGKLRLSLTLAVGLVSAATGDTLGYWLGRRYGRHAVERYGRWLLGGPDRLAVAKRFVERHGPLGVFMARFAPGFRFAAGPLAGALGMPFGAFATTNLLGGAVYVPLAVAGGYAIGYGFGAQIKRALAAVGRVEEVVLVAAILATVALLAWRLRRARRARHR